MPSIHAKRSTGETGAARKWDRHAGQHHLTPVNKELVDHPKRVRAILTRSERAKIRILYQHRVGSLATIAAAVGRGISSVKRTVVRERKSSQDEDDDYDHVDAAFKAQYPPLSGTLPKNQNATALGGRRSEPIDLVSDDDDGTHYKRDNNNTPVPIPVPGPDSGPESLVAFLSQLAHDIAWVHTHLALQDLGTLEKLLAVADWPEEELHAMFREALPGVGAPQRFILVKGMKDRCGEMENGVSRRMEVY